MHCKSILAAVVFWAMFIIAVLSGGAYYPGFDFKDGTLLYLLNIFGRLGSGLGAVISFVLMSSPPNNVAFQPFPPGGVIVIKDPDEALVERCRKGDGAAFAVLVERYEGPIYNAAYRVLGNAEDASDITQHRCSSAY